MLVKTYRRAFPDDRLKLVERNGTAIGRYGKKRHLPCERIRLYTTGVGGH